MSVLLAGLDGDVLVLTLNRPDKANAMNQAMHDEFVAQLARAREDDRIGAVVLTAAGERTFSAGADLTEFAELEHARALTQLPGVAFRPNKHFLNKGLRAALVDAAAEADRL